MEFGDNLVQFNIFEAMKHPTEYPLLFGIDVIDELVAEYLQLETNSAEFSNFAEDIDVIGCLGSVSDEYDYDELLEVQDHSDSEDDTVRTTSRPFSLFLKEYGIVPQYTMPSKPSMKGVAERRNRTLNDMVRSVISHSSLLESLCGEALKIAIYIFNRVQTKAINKSPYKLWTSKKPSIKYAHLGPHERKLDSRIVSCYFVGYVKFSRGYKFYNPTSRSFFKTGNARILEDVEFGKEDNIRNEESVNDIDQVLVPITIQETTQIIRDNVQTIVLDIALPQAHIEQPQQPQQPQEVSLRRSIKERRHAIPDDYIVFLLEHEDDIGLIEDDPIKFYQAMQSSNSQKWIDVMKDELKSMQDNDVWNLVELREGIFKTKNDSKGNIERYKAHLVAKDFTQKEGINYYKETFSLISVKDSFRAAMALVAHFDLELHQMNAKIAFLNGDIDETIYLMQPKNFVSK
ncbi:hypothetical protein CR513_55302, partial [Mucuna pruriens]